MAAVVDGASVLVTGNGGRTVTRPTTPCGAAGRSFPAATSVAVEGPYGLALLCTGQGYVSHTDKTVYVSGDLGFTTVSDGVVIHGRPVFGDMLGRLLLTDDGGLTWHAVTS